MKIEPKIAIACRNEVEFKVALRMLEKADIRWFNGDKATEFETVLDICRLYINPPSRTRSYMFLEYSDDPEDFTCDDIDGFEWTYVEASDIFRNQLISIRRAKS